MPPEDQLLLRAAARAVMDAADGGLRNQLTRSQVPYAAGPTRSEVSERATPIMAPVPPSPSAADRGLELFNGLGGFADDGREYVMRVNAETGLPPAPWTNVVAHARFGFACTESGPGYTWSQNSHDNRLTPWRNDPVSDAPGEAVFIRDEDSGSFWSATPLPAGGAHSYTVRHGHGYSVYEHVREKLASELLLFVPQDQPVKIFRLAIRNTSPRRRHCSVTLYAEWVLGENRSRTGIHVVTGTEPIAGTVLARNGFRQEFPERVAFLDLSPGESRSVTGDRTEFIGRNGSLRWPAALGRERLSNRTGPALDPCGAVRVEIDLEPNAEQVVIGLLGDAVDTAQVRALVERYPRPPARRRRARRPCGRSGTGCSERWPCARPIGRWTSSSIAGCPIRRWRAASGGDRRSISPAAPSDSAISCRTPWRW